MSKTIKTLFALALLVSAMPLAACNTMAGAGQDIEAGGENLTDASRDVQSDM